MPDVEGPSAFLGPQPFRLRPGEGVPPSYFGVARNCLLCPVHCAALRGLRSVAQIAKETLDRAFLRARPLVASSVAASPQPVLAPRLRVPAVRNSP